MPAQPTAPLVPPACPVLTSPPPLPCTSALRGPSPPAFSNSVLPAPQEATVPIPGTLLSRYQVMSVYLRYALKDNANVPSSAVLLLCCYASQEPTPSATNQNVPPAQQGGRVPPVMDRLMWRVPRGRTPMVAAPPAPSVPRVLPAPPPSRLCRCPAWLAPSLQGCRLSAPCARPDCKLPHFRAMC